MAHTAPPKRFSMDSEGFKEAPRRMQPQPREKHRPYYHYEEYDESLFGPDRLHHHEFDPDLGDR